MVARRRPRDEQHGVPRYGPRERNNLLLQGWHRQRLRHHLFLRRERGELPVWNPGNSSRHHRNSPLGQFGPSDLDRQLGQRNRFCHRARAGGRRSVDAGRDGCRRGCHLPGYGAPALDGLFLPRGRGQRSPALVCLAGLRHNDPCLESQPRQQQLVRIGHGGFSVSANRLAGAVVSGARRGGCKDRDRVVGRLGHRGRSLFVFHKMRAARTEYRIHAERICPGQRRDVGSGFQARGQCRRNRQSHPLAGQQLGPVAGDQNRFHHQFQLHTCLPARLSRGQCREGMD